MPFSKTSFTKATVAISQVDYLIATKTSSCVNLSKTAPLKLKISISKSRHVAHKLNKST